MSTDAVMRSNMLFNRNTVGWVSCYYPLFKAFRPFISIIIGSTVYYMYRVVNEMGAMCVMEEEFIPLTKSETQLVRMCLNEKNQQYWDQYFMIW